MADNGAPEDQSNESTSAQEFPHKMRVHALARILGITSREVLAFLAELGVAARSPQSSIDRSAAVQVRDRASAPAGEPVAESAEGDAPTDDAPATEKATPSAFEQTPSLFSAAAATEPVAPAADAPASEPAYDAAQTPLFLQPQAPERPARARRAERPTAEATADPSEKVGADTSPRETPATEVVTPSAEAEAETTDGDRTGSDDRSDNDGEGGANRRRRRGRRGRGRGRGDQSGDEQNSDDQSGDDESRDDQNRADRNRDDENGDATSGSDDSTSGRTDEGDSTGDDTNADANDDETTGSRGSGRSRNARRSGGKSAGGDTTSAPENESSDGSPSNSDDDSDSDADGDDSDDESGSGTRRRRRRRRRKGGAGDGDGDGSSRADGSTNDDPPNTVVHEREPRNKSRSRDRDEVQGISGSTRLEAKRQRRRDGRDAGRRRPPILTESEFLARREAVDRVMVVRERSANTRLNDDTGETTATEDYTQVAVLEDGVLVEHFVTTSTSSSMVGNIFLGRVQNVLPGMEAAFVDIGRGRNGVLYAGEVNWDAAGLDGGSRKIEQALKPGDPVVVQVSKDPVGHKGARLTTQISLAGRYLVYVPGGSSTGISRKLPDTERKRLKSILSKLIPSDAGVIIRTASEGVSAEELAADIDRLKNQWAQIEKVTAQAGGNNGGGGKGGKNGSKGSAPQALYEEPDLLVKVVRDLFNEDFTSLIVDGNSAWDQVHGYVEAVAPDLMERLERFEKAHADAPDAFVVHRIDEQLAKALERKVWLPSGGTLIIEHTEAMTVVDVNTGKFTGSGGNLEETVTRNNLEAAEEIVRQMRLRDIGGMIIVDFIDMVLESNRDLVLRRLTEALSRDRTRHQVSEVTSLGLVQMTRKRLGTGLLEAFSSTCTCCNGRGIVVHADPVEVQSGDDAPRQEGSKRSRRGGKRKSEASTESKPAHNPSEHPMFRAMASHGDEPADDAGHETAGHETAADASGPATEVEVVVETSTDAEVAVVEVTGPAEVDASPEVADDVEIAPATAAPTETTPTETTTEDAAPKRRRRAARRPAAAPTGGGEAVAGTAEALAATVATTTPVTTITAATSEEPTVAVRTRPRRRAAGRPAGPPVEE
ncbi:ribonuclease E [Williamsia sp. Leaf354]|uniref:translation initiation factor IF-2 N-terminal domain-containing protein n=1 Tax=Williamsia sp. Leaf354 TaxID=1736349 RepID=UPI0006F94EE1|nr:translation initiation factor IF-2 N-terminal domain-containing protein [Williamsia sp. Leaf354]KQR98887.1 ribonuclease E [Williamsia sp. Leaf354]